MEIQSLNTPSGSKCFASQFEAPGHLPKPLAISTLDLPTFSFSGKYKSPIYIPEWERIIIGHYGSNRLSLWNSKTLQLVDFRYTREKLHFCLAYSKKTEMIYSSGLDGQVTGIRVERNGLGYFGDDVISPKLSEKIEKISCLDNCNLLACTSGDASIYLLDISTLEVKGTLFLNEANVSWELAYIPKDNILAVLGGDDKESFIFFFSLKTFKCIQKLPAGHEEVGNKALTFCDQRNMLIAQPKMNLIKFWSLHSGQRAKAHKTIVLPDRSQSFCLVEELDLLLVSLKNGQLHFYQLSTGQFLRSLYIFFEIESIFKLQDEEKIFVINKDFSQIVIIKYSQLEF